MSINASDNQVTDLHLCLRRGHYGTKLEPLDLRYINSDQHLFESMRTSRERAYSRWRLRFDLRGLRTIRFVQFVMHRFEYVDIKKADDIPPHDRLAELKYLYNPAPADYLPPIGENHLTHLYYHPECAEDSRCVLLALFPKKTEERLAVCPRRGMTTGWGVQLVEGWNWERIWTLGLVLVLGGLAFAGAWWALQRDLQGAFAVASYITSFLTILMGMVQVRMSPSAS